MPVVSGDELQRRRNEILDAARACFAEYGYEGATVRRLEESTGKSRGAIFHHFGDKESLFLAMARRDAAQQAEIVASDGLVEVLRDMLQRPEHYQWLRTRLEIAAIVRKDPEFKAKWQDQQAVLDAAIRDRLRRNTETGELRDDHSVEAIATFLDIVMDGFIARLASGCPTEDLDTVLDIVEEAVRAR
ncbi:TetR/AcrR family transcriptional regulator [Corynebacterium uterequi]|uniref:Transcriptional regulator, TetR family n=1 Tax=Corynebacterium uterequi TaxID=1072256 RepID=A0A0G3HCW6_9CORY|nr:TetR/AcrR family transcriptional regulator [Corynebacterium uterequi]AKK11114.1 transcriptional regulator, TetR family [Corynebacterium uterequi]